jgi:hypothetical protein
MLKFRATDDLEVYISDIGCIVLKQYSLEHGKTVTIVITPEQAWEVSKLIQDFYDSMVEEWDGGRIKE